MRQMSATGPPLESAHLVVAGDVGAAAAPSACRGDRFQTPGGVGKGPRPRSRPVRPGREAGRSGRAAFRRSYPQPHKVSSRLGHHPGLDDISTCAKRHVAPESAIFKDTLRVEALSRAWPMIMPCSSTDNQRHSDDRTAAAMIVPVLRMYQHWFADLIAIRRHQLRSAPTVDGSGQSPFDSARVAEL